MTDTRRSPIPGIELVVVDLGRVDGGEACLCAEERERAARFRSDRERRWYVASHALLRELLGARLGAAPASVPLCAEPHGKPRVPGSQLHLSLSRSGALAVYAFARDRPVGVDIEAVRALSDAHAIAQRTFPRRERDAYASLQPSERLTGFFRGWTRTEALAKALGGGLSMPTETLDAALENAWQVASLAVGPRFAVAIAAAPHPG